MIYYVIKVSAISCTIAFDNGLLHIPKYLEPVTQVYDHVATAHAPNTCAS